MQAGRSGRSSLVLGVADTSVTEKGYVSDTRVSFFLSSKRAGSDEAEAPHGPSAGECIERGCCLLILGA